MTDLHYALLAEDYVTAQTILQQIGLVLLASNRVRTLQEATGKFPESIIDGDAWISFFCGMGHLEINPPEAYRYLIQAREKFAAEKELLGEFLATSQLVFYHVLVDGMLEAGRPFLYRTDELYRLFEDQLPPVVRFHAANNLSVGFSYIDADISQAEYYSTIAQRLTEEFGHDNFRARSLLSDMYLHGFRGNWAALRKNSERIVALSRSSAVSDLNKMIGQLTLVNNMLMEGDFENYRRHRDRLFADDALGLAAKTVIKPFTLLFDIDMFIACGQFGEAERALLEASHAAGAAIQPHLRSQYLH